jgi:hypothetical protein
MNQIGERRTTMKTIWLMLLAALTALGCNPSPTPSPSPVVDAAAPPVTAVAAGAQTSRHAVDERPVRAFPPSEPYAAVAKPDPRTPAQIISAACAAPAHCVGSAIPHLMAASSTPQIPPPSWSVPNWYLDFANSTGCASDSNSGTQGTCGAAGSGIGPLLHVSQLYARWGTHAPTLLPPSLVTTINVLSSQPVGSISTDPWGNFAPVAPDGMIALVGALQPVGATCTDGAVTAISRANPGNDWKVAAGTCTYVAGQLLYNSSVAGGSYAVVDSVLAGTATLTPPFASAGLTTLSNSPTFVVDGASWNGAGGDTIQVYTRPIIYMDQLAPVTGTTPGVGGGNTGGSAWIQGVEFGAGSTGANIGQFTIAASGGLTITNSQTDNVAVLNGSSAAPAVLSGNQYLANDWFPDDLVVNAGDNSLVLFGGAVGTTIGNPVFYGGWLQADTIVHNGGGFFGGTTTIYNAHLVSGTASVFPGATVQLEPSGTNGVLWGAGAIRVYENASVINRTGGTWSNNVLVSALQLRINAATSTTGFVPPQSGTITMNGTTQVTNSTGTFPAGASVAFSLNAAGGTPCLGAPYFSQATIANSFYVKDVTAGCNDVLNWYVPPMGGVSITSANLDTYLAIYDPAGGARFSN